MVRQVIALRHTQFRQGVASTDFRPQFAFGIIAFPVQPMLRPVHQLVQRRGVKLLRFGKTFLMRQLDEIAVTSEGTAIKCLVAAIANIRTSGSNRPISRLVVDELVLDHGVRDTKVIQTFAFDLIQIEYMELLEKAERLRGFFAGVGISLGFFDGLPQHNRGAPLTGLNVLRPPHDVTAKLFPLAIRSPTVFAYTQPADLRKSFTGLVGIVERELGQTVESGHYFLFFNRRRNSVKVLAFVGDGLLILYKRLETGTFELPRALNNADQAAAIELRMSELALILEGIELSSVRRRRRWRREVASA